MSVDSVNQLVYHHLKDNVGPKIAKKFFKALSEAEKEEIEIDTVPKKTIDDLRTFYVSNSSSQNSAKKSQKSSNKNAHKNSPSTTKLPEKRKAQSLDSEGEESVASSKEEVVDRDKEKQKRLVASLLNYDPMDKSAPVETGFDGGNGRFNGRGGGSRGRGGQSSWRGGRGRGGGGGGRGGGKRPFGSGSNGVGLGKKKKFE